MATVHTVVKGDTLWGIAEKYLGSGTKYKQLAAINNIPNPDLIYVGQKIKIEKDSSSTSSSSSSSSNKPTINQFGLQSNNDSGNVLFATWNWGKESNTASYKVMWTYDTGNSVWFIGNNSSITVDKDFREIAKQSTYSIPDNAKRVQFRVKPISETYTKNNVETHHWTAEWSTVVTYDTSKNPPVAPGTPNVEIEKYTLTATLDNLDESIKKVQFQVVKNDTTVFKTGTATVTTSHASFSCTLDAGAEYKVRCKALNDSGESAWSAYSNNEGTIPAAPSGITAIRATSETSVYLEWSASKTATTYDIQYTTKKDYFDGSDQVQSQNGIESNHFEKTGLETGTEYFFRVRAVNEDGESPWSDIKSVVVGSDPAAPTTWSSTTTVITGEILTLYWVHNAEDGSSQTFAELELYINNVKETYTIENSKDEEKKDKTSFYEIDTSPYIEGTTIQWRVRTAGITKAYGDWSVQRTIDVYAPPTLEMGLTDKDGVMIETITEFPAYVSALAGPNTQAPIGYHLSITSKEIYETTDSVGNVKMVNSGEEVYSKYFDINDPLMVELSANNIDLENNIEYTITCTVSMNSGLTASASIDFTVNWTDEQYLPNAEIGIDMDTYTANIRPYCNNQTLVCHRVDVSGTAYTVSSDELSDVWGETVAGALTTTGEQVYLGVDADDNEVYFCWVEEIVPITDVYLSVYRREFDGSFTELATGLDGAKATTITDPHPALDLARYRIVAISKTTGAVSFYDPPGYPVGCKAVIIQWNEQWTTFDTSEESELEQPAWSGSLLKLPYNIDVSDSNTSDVSLIEYIGRSHPVSYYGTQLGSTSSWKVEIDKKDKETLYALRRLAIWLGDVYVREPSGSGYWANISVSFSQTHLNLTIPVTIDVTRVEGGI